MPNLNVNGKTHQVNAEPETSLLEVLRNDLELTGAKYGCGESQCGACTVLIDGQAVRSCITPLRDAVNKKVTTIEGLGAPENLHPLQKAFIEHDAMQCGYCVPGMIMNAAGLLEQNPDASEAQLMAGMEGNVCRCGGYRNMVDAIKAAAHEMRGER